MKDFKPGDVVWCIQKKGIKHYTVWASSIQGIQFTEDKGFQYILAIGGPTDPKDCFQGTDRNLAKDSPELEAEENRLYQLVKTEAEKRWAMEKESSLLVSPNSATVLPAGMFGNMIKG